MPDRTICAIHQPNFFPRLSTLAKLYAADVWVVLDDVQYNGRDYQNRCRLALLDNPAKWQWLSLPVHRPHGRASRIDEVQLAEQRKSRHRVAHLLQQRYGRSPSWPAFQKELDPVLGLIGGSGYLAYIADASTLVLLRMLGWCGQVRRSSELPSRTGRSERLADLVQAVGADTYLCGTGGRRYLDTTPFADQGLAVRWFEPPATDAESVGVWSEARQTSGLWAMMRFGPDTVQAELNAEFDPRSPDGAE